MRKIWEELKSTGKLSTVFGAAMLIIFYMLLSNLEVVGGFLSGAYSIIRPFVWGVVISYLLYHVTEFLKRTVFKWIKKRNIAHILAVTVAVLLTVVLLSLLMSAVVPQMVSAVSILLNNTDSYIATLEKLLVDLDRSLPFIDLDTESLTDIGGDILKTATKWVQANTDIIISTTVSVGNSLMNVILIFFMVIYVLFDTDSLKKGVSRLFQALLSPLQYVNFSRFALKADRVFMTFIGQNFLDATLVGVLNYIFMIATGMNDYAILISVIAGVTNFIPTFGPIIGAVVNIVLLLVIDPVDALWFALWTFLLQTVDGYIVKPILFSKGIKVKSLWVLIAIVVGGGVGGVTGMIIGIPVFALVSDAYEEWIERMLQKKTIEE
ncbi:MAG: AI-2E family transporter [Eubacteriaceae bacterium]|nr:AI-2E family transporter [Eubacteriaceae bacterium]